MSIGMQHLLDEKLSQLRDRYAHLDGLGTSWMKPSSLQGLAVPVSSAPAHVGMGCDASIPAALALHPSSTPPAPLMQPQRTVQIVHTPTAHVYAPAGSRQIGQGQSVLGTAPISAATNPVDDPAHRSPRKPMHSDTYEKAVADDTMKQLGYIVKDNQQKRVAVPQQSMLLRTTSPIQRANPDEASRTHATAPVSSPVPARELVAVTKPELPLTVTYSSPQAHLQRTARGQNRVAERYEKREGPPDLAAILSQVAAHPDAPLSAAEQTALFRAGEEAFGAIRDKSSTAVHRAYHNIIGKHAPREVAAVMDQATQRVLALRTRHT